MTVQQPPRNADSHPDQEGPDDMRQDARGVTLIELLVAMTVMAVLLGIGVPSFQSLHRNARTDTCLHLLTTSLAFARMASVKSGMAVTVCPSTDGVHCRLDTLWDDGWIVFDDPTHARQPANPESVLQRVEMTGLHVRSTPGRTRVRFTPDGAAYGSNLSIRLCAMKSGQLLGRVVVNNGGRARSGHVKSPELCR